MKRGGSFSFLVRTISNVLVMEIGWTDVGSGGYILVSCAHSKTSFICDSTSSVSQIYKIYLLPPAHHGEVEVGFSSRIFKKEIIYYLFSFNIHA